MRRRSFLFLVAATLPDWGRALVKPGVLEDFSRQYGSQAVRRLNAWRELMDEISGLPLPSRLTRTNAFFNQLAFAEDGEQFGSRDYWATPLEFLGRGRGDCEEFAIAKYVTLVKGGVPLEQLLNDAQREVVELAHQAWNAYMTTKQQLVYLDMFVDSAVNTRCLLYTSPSPRDLSTSRMPSSA